MKMPLFRPALVLILALPCASAGQVVYGEFHQDFSDGFETPYRPNLSEEERIAGLSTLWTEAKHNFVYFDRLHKLNWDERYLEYLPKVRAAGSTLEYYRLLQRLCAELRDAHTIVRMPRQLAPTAESVPAVQIGRIGGKVVITTVDDPTLAKMRVHPGAEIASVEGIPVERYAAERVGPYYGDDHRTLHYLLGGARDQPVALELRDDRGADFMVKLPRVRLVAEATAQMETPRFAFKLLTGNIGYLALNTFRDPGIVDDFMAAFASVKTTDALIIDVRNNHGGNSGYSDRILACFTHERIASELLESPLLMFTELGGLTPRRASWTRNIEPHWSLLYTKQVVLLMGAHTASAAESFVVGFDSLRRGKMIGQKTAGATGQPVKFALPGGGTGSVCAMRVRYASGKEFTFTGSNPDIEVQITAADLRAGRDAVLETAVRCIAQQRSPAR